MTAVAHSSLYSSQILRLIDSGLNPIQLLFVERGLTRLRHNSSDNPVREPARESLINSDLRITGVDQLNF